MDITITGTEDFQRAARALRQYGSKEQRGEFAKAINSATKPIRTAQKAAIGTYLPSSGGLASDVSRSTRLTTRRRASGAGAGIRIQAQNKRRDIRGLNRGRLRHPLYGNRRFWFTQSVRPGWFDDPAEAGAPLVRRELVGVMRRTVEKIARASR